MDLVGYDMTKLVRLFAAVRLEGQVYLPQAAMRLVERYKFAGMPKSVEDLTGDRVSFKQGLFDGVGIEGFEIYNDGVIVTSKASSEVLEAFLTDLVGWMDKELGLKIAETHKVNKAYESHLIVHTNAPVLSVLEKVAPIQDMVTRFVHKAMNVDAKFHPFALWLSPDVSLIPSLKPIPFRFERRATLAFETNYYYSAAPLPTADHLKVLQELEKLVS